LRTDSLNVSIDVRPAEMIAIVGRSGSGKTEDNRYVNPDVDQLPKPDRQKFRQHVYW